MRACGQAQRTCSRPMRSSSTTTRSNQRKSSACPDMSHVKGVHEHVRHGALHLWRLVSNNRRPSVDLAHTSNPEGSARMAGGFLRALDQGYSSALYAGEG